MYRAGGCLISLLGLPGEQHHTHNSDIKPFFQLISNAGNQKRLRRGSYHKCTTTISGGRRAESTSAMAK